MGTKLQYALNPFSTTSRNSSSLNKIADWGGVRGHSKRTVMHHSMDEMLDLQSQKIESIKQTMQMHEEIFQRQVRELHRLYDRQMKLKYELKRQMAYTCGPLGTKDVNISQFSIWKKQMQDIRSNLPYSLTYDSGERSPGCTGKSQSQSQSQRMPKAFNLERVAEECPSTRIHNTEQDQEGPNGFRPSQSARMNTGGLDEDIDVELTLSIGGSNSRKRSNIERKPCSLELEGLGSSFSMKQLSSSAVRKPETREDFGEPCSPALSSTSATQKQDNISTSNWLLQDLSLTRT